MPLNAEQMKILYLFYCVDGEQLDMEQGGEWKQLCRKGPGVLSMSQRCALGIPVGLGVLQEGWGSCSFPLLSV